MKTEIISVSKGKANTDLGEFIGEKDQYKGISIKGKSDILPAHINKHGKSDYLDTIIVELIDKNNVGINLFKINTCKDSSILQLHIATGKHLNSINHKLAYKSRKELMLYSSVPEQIQIEFIVYNYQKGNEKDLFIFKCGKTYKQKIAVYDELEDLENALMKNNFLNQYESIDAHPKTKKGSILQGGNP